MEQRVLEEKCFDAYYYSSLLAGGERASCQTFAVFFLLLKLKLTVVLPAVGISLLPNEFLQYTG